MPDTLTPASDRITLLSDQDLYLFNEGSNYRLYETMGAHLVSRDGQSGRSLQRVGAERASDFCHRQLQRMGLQISSASAAGASGIWEGFIPGVNKGALYKFHIESIAIMAITSIRPIPSAYCTRSLHAPLPWCGTSTTNGTIASGWQSAPPAIPCAPRKPFMKFISARGCGFPKNTIAR